MRLNEILRLVFINLKQNKFKVFLTSLGIIVGAATIVMVIAIGEGGKQDVEEQFKTLNAGTVTVTSGGVDMEAMMGASRVGKTIGKFEAVICLNTLYYNSFSGIKLYQPHGEVR